MSNDWMTIPLDGPMDERVDPFYAPRGVNTDVSGLRHGPRSEMLSHDPAISGSILTWSTASVVPALFAGCTVGDALLDVRPDVGQWSVGGGRAAHLGSTTATYPTSSRGNTWFAAQVVRSQIVADFGSTSGPTTIPVCAVCKTSGYRVVAVKRQGRDGIELSLWDARGEPIVSNKLVTTTGGVADESPYPIALTPHSGNRVALWYHKYTSGAVPSIVWRLISITGSGMTIGVETTLCTPLVPGPFSVTSEGDDGIGFVIHGSTSTSTSATLSVVDVNGTVSATTSFSLQVSPTRETPYAISTLNGLLAVGWISGSGEVKGTVLAADSGLAAYDPVRTRLNSTAYSGSLVVGWSSTSGGGNVPVWIASSRGPMPTGEIPRTVWSFDLTGSIGTVTIDGSVPMGAAANWRVSDTGWTFPIVPLVRMYRSASSLLDDSYVADKSIELYTANTINDSTGSFIVSPFARLGAYIAFDAPVFPLSITSTEGDRVGIGYPVYRGDRTTVVADSLRYTEVLLASSGSPGRVPWTAPSRHATCIGSALPVYWDGREVAEAGFLHRPHLTASTTGGTGPALNGTFSFTALYTYVDGAGQLRRSAPSNVVTLELASSAPKLYVSCADGMKGLRGGGLPHSLQLYASDGSGSVGYLIPGTVSAIVNGMYAFHTVVTGVVGNPMIYTAGGALPAECPPALWDVAGVEDRLWGIDAERRDRILYTKKKENGIAYEWNAALELLLSSDAGDAIAVRSWAGIPLILAENGIYVVQGSGPDNAGGGALYNEPTSVARLRVSPLSRGTAVVTPQGLFFTSISGPAIWDGSKVTYLDRLLGRDDGSMCTHVGSTDEIFSFGEETFCIGTDTGHISRWSPSELSSGERLVCGVVKGGSGSLGEGLLIASDRKLWVIDDTTSESADPWSILTGWISPSGPVGAATIGEWWIVGHLLNTGSIVNVTQWTDGGSTSSTLVFSASTISNAVESTPTTLTLRGLPGQKRVNSIRFNISGSCPDGGRGFIPTELHLKVFGSNDHNPRRATVILSPE